MSWKKILVLSLILVALVAAIVLVNRREKGKKASDAALLDIPSASIEKIELRNRGNRFVFSRQDTLWALEEPLRAKADKVVLENILDNFCQLKYDRLVEEGTSNLRKFGLDNPDIELKLLSKDKPAQIIQLGMRNSLDDSSYAKLATGGKVVTIAAYKRNDLEKDLFSFRDKKFFDIDTVTVTAMSYHYEDNALAFVKKDGQWFMEKPVYSLVQEAKVNDILSSASLLEALSFSPMNAANARAFGLEKPLLMVEFQSKAGLRKIEVGQKGDQYYAQVDGSTEIYGINKDFLEKFDGEAVAFREKKLAVFYAYDVRELAFQHGIFQFTARKNAAGTWEFAMPFSGKKPSEEKIDRLLTALAGLEAREFMEGGKRLPEFTTRIVMKTEDPADPGKLNDIIMELSAAEGETVIARNPALPYCFKIGKEIMEKLPGKMEDICEETAKTSAAVK